MKLKNKLDGPTREDLVTQFNSCSRFGYFIIYLVTRLNENTFSFISGLIANIPISILLSLTTIKFETSCYGIGFAISLVVSVIFAVILLIASFKFALKHIEINKIADREQNKEIYNNKLYELCFEKLNYLKIQLILGIIFSVLLLGSLASMIIFFNLK